MSERSGREQPMTDTSEATNARRLARLASGRLRHARWLLAAAVAGVILVHAAGGGSLPLAAGIIAALFAVAAIAPRQLKRKAAAEAVTPAWPRPSSDLSAESLAAAVADPLIVFDARGAVVLANRAAASAFGDMNVGISLPLKFRAPEIQQVLERMLSGHSVSETTEYTERVPFERVFGSPRPPSATAPAFLSSSSRIAAKRAALTACAPISSPTPATNCARRWPRSPASSRRFVGRPATIQAAREQFLQIMQNQTARMARLIDDLLSLSRLEMKALGIAERKVDLVGVIAGVVEIAAAARRAISA